MEYEAALLGHKVADPAVICLGKARAGSSTVTRLKERRKAIEATLAEVLGSAHCG